MTEEERKKYGADTVRVMGSRLHPFISGQPFRIRYLQEVLLLVSSWKDKKG
ncbi:hypothetical protein [Tengunoibacter tsumagoiensis]|uniref:hypothetical protein n=1 Tax=Tengunoibacter tsumagoiensis TaxID=2014871 RepID=UPI00138759E4|nr:hypothetical protein [Tengunoibacter tsumagoiensis]